MILLGAYPGCLLVETLGWWIFEPLEVLARVLEVFGHLSDRVLIMLVFRFHTRGACLVGVEWVVSMGLSLVARWVASTWFYGLW